MEVDLDFANRLNDKIRQKGTPCVVGLDPDLALFSPEEIAGLPPEGRAERAIEVAHLFLERNKRVIDEVHGLVCAVKPQSAFYERLGSKGIEALERTIAYARQHDLTVIMDAKRGDIASTAKAYADSYIGPRDAPMASDALTLSPYLGNDSLIPFFDACRVYGTGVFVCAMTSNPGAGSLQMLEAKGRPVYQHVAQMVRQLGGSDFSGYSPFGIVAGATYPQQAMWLRAELPHTIFLVPGMGAQGGDPSLLKSFFNHDGLGAVVSSSRAIMFPQRFGGQRSFRKAAAEFVDHVRQAIS